MSTWNVYESIHSTNLSIEIFHRKYQEEHINEWHSFQLVIYLIIIFYLSCETKQQNRVSLTAPEAKLIPIDVDSSFSQYVCVVCVSGHMYSNVCVQVEVHVCSHVQTQGWLEYSAIAFALFIEAVSQLKPGISHMTVSLTWLFGGIRWPLIVTWHLHGFCGWNSGPTWTWYLASTLTTEQSPLSFSLLTGIFQRQRINKIWTSLKSL